MECQYVQIILKALASMGYTKSSGIMFYGFLAFEASALAVLSLTSNIQTTAFFIFFFNAAAASIQLHPSPQNQPKQSSISLLGPLLASCVSKFTILIILWLKYESIIQGSASNFVAGLLGFGFVLASGINVAHQLMHRSETWCQALSYLLLVIYQFTIYPTEHLYMHHKFVGSPDDAVTCPKNVSYYQYFCQVLARGYTFTMRHNWHIFCCCVASTVLYNAFLLALTLKEGSGIQKYFFFTLLSYSALFIMEGVEYVEHYGLVYRSKGRDGQLKEECAWNTSENQIINCLNFRFQDHSDHHLHPFKSYSSYSITQAMPRLPFDFIVGATIGLFPRLWYSVMNPLVDQVINHKAVPQDHQKYVRQISKATCVLTMAPFMIKVVECLKERLE